MLFLIAFVGAAIIAVVLWRAMNTATGGDVTEAPTRPPVRSRVSGPDDDPEFLRQLDEKWRKHGDPPA